MAALYDSWENKETGETLYSYSVITTAAVPSFQWLHDRMPAILSDEKQLTQWLDSSASIETALSLLTPFAGELEIYPVSQAVGKATEDTIQNIQKIELKHNPASQTTDIRKYFTVKKEKEIKEDNEEKKEEPPSICKIEQSAQVEPASILKTECGTKKSKGIKRECEDKKSSQPFKKRKLIQLLTTDTTTTTTITTDTTTNTTTKTTSNNENKSDE